MASRQNELHVDDLLNSFETTNKSTKDTKKNQPDTNDWDDQEEDGFALVGKTQQASKAKTKKKTTTAKGWGDADTATAPQQPTVDFATLQEGEKKKKIFNKPTGATKAAAQVVVDEEYFPSLGEERPKQAPKKAEPAPVAQPVSTASSSGPKRFMNAKKQGAGESFAPLEPVQERTLPVVTEKIEKTEKVEKTERVEKSEPVVQQRAPGFGFQRRTVEEQPKEEAVPVDTKFKFGGEGPRKFVGANKISFKREEEKSEQERAREEKEREVEEKLAREREELAKQRENREIKKNTKTEEKTEKTEQTESPKEKTEEPVEEKRIAKFSNSKKAEKPKTEEVVEKKVEEVVNETKPTVPVEGVEMHGSLSNKGWGDGPLVKKSQKK